MIYRVAVDIMLEEGRWGHIDVNLHDSLLEAEGLLICHGGSLRKF